MGVGNILLKTGYNQKGILVVILKNSFSLLGKIQIAVEKDTIVCDTF